MVDTAASGSEADPESASRSPGRFLFFGLRPGRLISLLPLPWLKGRNAEAKDSLAFVLRAHDGTGEPLDETERLMLDNLLQFRTVRVEDVMVPRADIIAVEVRTPFAEMVKQFQEASHSRLPLYSDTLDNPVGMIHIKDVLACFGADAYPGGPPEPHPSLAQAGGQNNSQKGAASQARGAELTCIDPPPSLLKLKKDVLFVPPSMPAADLLLQMRTQRIHMALVIDEYGGTDGLVTIEDLVEIIVGDIEDEHDMEAAEEFTALEGGGYQVSARMEVEDFHERTGLDLRLGDADDDEVDTLGGVVFTLAERVPRRGEIIRHPGGFDFEIVDADPRRIRKLRVMPRAGSDQSSEGRDRGEKKRSRPA